MKRPIGITLLALFHFLGAAVYALLGVAFLTGGPEIHELARVYGSYGEMIEGLGEELGVACLVVAAITLAIGIGLWMQKNWARLILVILTVFSLAVSAIWMVIMLVQSRTAGFFVQTLVTALHLPVLWYLLQPRVRQAFGGQPAQPGAAGAPPPETK
jgi:hypothetical protein